MQTPNHNASDYVDANGARFAVLLIGYEIRQRHSRLLPGCLNCFDQRRNHFKKIADDAIVC
jgi:hypothetical protein